MIDIMMFLLVFFVVHLPQHDRRLGLQMEIPPDTQQLKASTITVGVTKDARWSWQASR